MNLDLEELKRKLLRLTLGEGCPIDPSASGDVDIRVVETEAGWHRGIGSFYLMDEQGTFLDELGPRYADLAPPLVRGLEEETGTSRLTRRLWRDGYSGLWRIDERLESAVSEIDVSEGDGIDSNPFCEIRP